MLKCCCQICLERKFLSSVDCSFFELINYFRVFFHMRVIKDFFYDEWLNLEVDVLLGFLFHFVCLNHFSLATFFDSYFDVSFCLETFKGLIMLDLEVLALSWKHLLLVGSFGFLSFCWYEAVARVCRVNWEGTLILPVVELKLDDLRQILHRCFISYSQVRHWINLITGFYPPLALYNLSS